MQASEDMDEFRTLLQSSKSWIFFVPGRVSNTFKRYKSIISNTVAFRKDEKVVSFKYHTGGFQDLNELLNKYFQDIKLHIESIRKADMKDVLSK